MDWRELLSQLGQKVQGNLQASDKLNSDVGTQMMDRVLMSRNPNRQGPPLPEGLTPEEQQLGDAMASGMGGPSMGIAAPLRKAALTSLASGPGMIQSGTPMWKNMVETQIKNRAADSANRAKFQLLKSKLGGR